MKKLLIGFVLLAFTSSCFAGYSGGGRSGFSGGSRSFSSSRSYSTAGRSGYSRSTYSTRAYVAPRTYSRSYAGSNTVIHNNHYSHGGYGYGGNGFFSGFLGGYLGGSMANHHTTVVAGGGQVMPQGQGMLMEQAYVQPSYGDRLFGFIVGAIIVLFLFLLFIWASIALYRHLFSRPSYSSRW
jgi:hypothetical protein